MSGISTVWSSSLISACIATSFPSKLTVSKATAVKPLRLVVSTMNSISTVPEAADGVKVCSAVIPKGLPVFLSISVPVNVYVFPGRRLE